MRTYATTTDLTNWTGSEAPGNAAGLIRSASLLVERATLLATYAADSDGYPTDPDVAAAFRDATTEQAAYWHANGLDPTAGALAELGKNTATSKSIKGASVNHSVTLVEQVNVARRKALDTLSRDAWQILANAGLTGRDVMVL